MLLHGDGFKGRSVSNAAEADSSSAVVACVEQQVHVHDVKKQKKREAGAHALVVRAQLYAVPEVPPTAGRAVVAAALQQLAARVPVAVRVGKLPQATPSGCQGFRLYVLVLGLRV